jgi:hypothetical protein
VGVREPVTEAEVVGEVVDVFEGDNDTEPDTLTLEVTLDDNDFDGVTEIVGVREGVFEGVGVTDEVHVAV